MERIVRQQPPGMLLQLILLLLLMHCTSAASGSGSSGGGGLNVRYYSKSCPDAEAIIKRVVAAGVSAEPKQAPGLLRIFFHDSFGNNKNDASVLLDHNNNTEKHAVPNLTLHGFFIINDAKAAVEKKCPGVVSCADVLAYAARDALVLTGLPSFPVPGGRLDGRVSSAAEATKNLPSPFATVKELVARFASVGLSQQQMVALSGAHTIGDSETCASYKARLYHFNATFDIDPSMDPALAAKLRQVCPVQEVPTLDQHVDMDPVSPERFDEQYYKNLLQHQGLFSSDQALADTYQTQGLVRKYAGDRAAFLRDFTAAVTQMGSFGILKKPQGEIRLNCVEPNRPF